MYLLNKESVFLKFLPGLYRTTERSELPDPGVKHLATLLLQCRPIYYTDNRLRWRSGSVDNTLRWERSVFEYKTMMIPVSKGPSSHIRQILGDNS